MINLFNYKKGELMINLFDYKSPDSEASIFKGIPISERQNPVVRELMKSRLFSVRYRGTSKDNYDRPQDYCHKEYADTFAIYPHSNYEEYKEIRYYYTSNYDYDTCWDELKKFLQTRAEQIVFNTQDRFDRWEV